MLTPPSPLFLPLSFPDRTLVNNHIFFQHPDLIRILCVHENVMAVMMNTLGRRAQAAGETQTTEGEVTQTKEKVRPQTLPCLALCSSSPLPFPYSTFHPLTLLLSQPVTHSVSPHMHLFLYCSNQSIHQSVLRCSVTMFCVFKILPQLVNKFRQFCAFTFVCCFY